MEGNHLKTLSKTEDEIRVANHMVLFGGKDLYDEFFTPETQFESKYTKTGMLYVDWEHGLDWDDEAPGRDDILGVVDWKTATVDEQGLWVERVLSRRNEYMQYLETLIDEGLVGTSSEAVGGKVRKKADGEIQVWPLKRDALTVTPAEPRMMTENAITAIKALIPFQPKLKALLQDQVMVEDGATVEGEDNGGMLGTTVNNYVQVGTPTNDDHKVTVSGSGEEWTAIGSDQTLEKHGGTITMTEEIKTFSEDQLQQLKQLIGKQQEPEPAPEPVMDPAVKALTDQVEQLTEMIANSPKAKDAGYVAPDSESDHPEVKSFGDFLVAIRTGNKARLQDVYKTALAEGAGATGGYGVPVEYGGLLLEISKEFNALRRAGAMTTVLQGNSKEYPVLDIETAPTAADTAYAGGVTAAWTEEAAAISQSEPRFRQIKMILHKLAAYSLASNEVRDDFVEALDGIMARSFAKAIGSKEEYAFFRGDGVGKPLGIVNSGALISAARSAASTVALADLAQMISDFTPDSYNSGAWFCSPTVLDQIIQLVSNPLSWMDNMRDNWMQSSLLGYPLYVVGGLPALNTAGDILLVDPNYYLIADSVSGLNIAFSPHFKFQNDQIAWRITKRVDGQPLIDNSITMEDASTTVSPFVALAAG